MRRVTEEARLTAPSVGPDEAWAVAVVEGDGTNGLVRVDLRGGSIEELVPPEADTLCLLFIHPRALNLISLRSAGTMPA